MGLKNAGVSHIALVEWNHDACNTLRRNFDPAIVHEEDVRDFDFSSYSDVDIIAGGPPCQPFSLGGKANGYNDRRDMFPAATASIRTLKPKAFIFENVKGLLRKSFADYFKYILLQLEYPDFVLPYADWRQNFHALHEYDKTGRTEKEYDVSFSLVNTANYGVPQIRERVIIVGIRKDMNVKWEFPKPTHSKDALLWNMFVTGEYWRTHDKENYFPDSIAKETIKRLKAKYGVFAPTLAPWETVRDAIEGIGKTSGERELRDGAREYPGHTGSLIDWPSKTIKAGAHGVPGGENMLKLPDGRVRYYSVAEAKRIQTFPDEYAIEGSWTEAMRQLGNAVPVKLATRIAESVITALSSTEKKAPVAPQTIRMPQYNNSLAV